MMRFLVAATAVFMFAPQANAADDIDNLGGLGQAEFAGFSEDMNAILAYRGVQPAEPLGIIGFDVGIEASYIDVESSTAWATATGDDPAGIPSARIAVNKGLPFGIDVGAFYSAVPGSNAKIIGGQVRYALVEGGIATPAIGVRAGVSRLQGVDELDGETRSLDLSISKGFGPVTPYLGYGRVWGEFTPDPSTGLSPVEPEEDRTYAGVRFSLLVMQITVEAEQMGERTGYTAKLGFGF